MDKFYHLLIEYCIVADIFLSMNSPIIWRQFQNQDEWFLSLQPIEPLLEFFYSQILLY